MKRSINSEWPPLALQLRVKRPKVGTLIPWANYPNVRKSPKGIKESNKALVALKKSSSSFLVFNKKNHWKNNPKIRFQ